MQASWIMWQSIALPRHPLRHTKLLLQLICPNQSLRLSNQTKKYRKPIRLLAEHTIAGDLSMYSGIIAISAVNIRNKVLSCERRRKSCAFRTLEASGFLVAIHSVPAGRWKKYRDRVAFKIYSSKLEEPQLSVWRRCNSALIFKFLGCKSFKCLLRNIPPALFCVPVLCVFHCLVITARDVW